MPIFLLGAAEGQRVGIAFNFNGSDGQGEYGFFQELGATLQPHTTYTLEVEIGNITSATAMNGAFFPLEGFPGYRVELLAGGMMLEQDNNLLSGTISDGEFATSVITYTTGASHDLFDENLGILLVNLNQADPSFPASDIEVDFDNVRLDASPALAGDFDGDLDVDGADFLDWQRNTSVGNLSDWQTTYGSVLEPLGGLQSIPEPSSVWILLGGTAILYRKRSRL
ncbi:PEP-CTERM sorting domain-containing protein [Bythopirellula polymerisocia]|uniref:PEP-CTERM sorting domain-containing protein n=1 Tax=Bythopirellula polymerisocia TaxID=2528003 RepID=UPI0018D422A3|nr:PEP-CTERM sorting domain-containing protein [Bythopirellula polymerisocia]